MLRCVLLACLLLCSASAAAARSEVRLWHSMNGVRGAELARLVARFNASQSEFRVVATYKGQYDEASVEAVTRRASPRAPHIVQASEFGGAFLLEQQAVRPLWRVMKDARIALGAEGLLAAADDVSDAEGRLLALPFGRSTPVLYYNRDAFRRAKLDPAKPPATWTQMVGTLGALVESGGTPCAFTSAWPSSVLLESMSAWHNQAFATDPDAGRRLVFNGRLTVRWVSMLVTWLKSGYFTYATRPGEAEARFALGDCALLTASSANYPELRDSVMFDLGVAQLPYFDDFDDAPLNTLTAGAALWVLEGRQKKDYAGVARFLAFFARPEMQAQWHQRTALVPLTTAAYELLRKRGFYAANPGHEVAVRQLLAKGTPNWKGLRLAQFPQLRSIVDEELDSAWLGTKTALDALNSAVYRGNRVLEGLKSK
jgi:sn-glycerol 3-phosphate transport system substrate-binding protein